MFRKWSRARTEISTIHSSSHLLKKVSRPEDRSTRSTSCKTPLLRNIFKYPSTAMHNKCTGKELPKTDTITAAITNSTFSSEAAVGRKASRQPSTKRPTKTSQTSKVPTNERLSHVSKHSNLLPETEQT